MSASASAAAVMPLATANNGQLPLSSQTLTGMMRHEGHTPGLVSDAPAMRCASDVPWPVGSEASPAANEMGLSMRPASVESAGLTPVSMTAMSGKACGAGSVVSVSLIFCCHHAGMTLPSETVSPDGANTILGIVAISPGIELAKVLSDRASEVLAGNCTWSMPRRGLLPMTEPPLAVMAVIACCSSAGSICTMTWPETISTEPMPSMETVVVPV